jgi:TP901 family phage tail tape measure protein
MAFKIADLYARLTARDGALRVTLHKARGYLSATALKMDAVAKAAKKVFLVSASLIAGVIFSFARFEQSMARVRALTGATEAQFQAMKKTALDLGRTTVFSARQAAEAMSYFALAGYDANKIIGAMPATLQLAAAGQMDMAQATDIVMKIMASMEIQASDLGHTVDVLTKAFTSANTDLPMLGEAMKYAGPIANQLEKNLEEVVSAIQAMSNAGIQGGQAGSSMRIILAKLSGSSEEANRVFENLGVTLTDGQGKMRHLADIIDDLNRAMSGLGSAEKAGLMFQAFGARAVGLAPLLAAGGEELRRLERQLQRSGGTAKMIADRQLNTLQGRFKLMVSAAEGLSITLGKALKPSIEALTGALTGLINGLNAMSPWLTKSIAQVLLFTTVLTGLLVVLPKVKAALMSMLHHPVLLAIAVLGALAMALTSAGREIQEFDATIGQASAQAGELAAKHMALYNRLEDLLNQTKRTNAEQNEANNIAKKLEESYGDLYFVYDRLGNVVGVTAKSFDALNKRTKQKVHAALESDVRKAHDEIKRLQKDLDETISRSKSPWRPISTWTTDQPRARKLGKELEAAQKVYMDLLGELKDFEGDLETERTQRMKQEQAKRAAIRLQEAEAVKRMQDEIAASYKTDEENAVDAAKRKADEYRDIVKRGVRDHLAASAEKAKITAWEINETKRIRQEYEEERKREANKKAEEAKAEADERKSIEQTLQDQILEAQKGTAKLRMTQLKRWVAEMKEKYPQMTKLIESRAKIEKEAIDAEEKLKALRKKVDEQKEPISEIGQVFIGIQEMTRRIQEAAFKGERDRIQKEQLEEQKKTRKAVEKLEQTARKGGRLPVVLSN